MKERLEKLVPPRELCEKIPHIQERVAAIFNDSALVHAYSEPCMRWQVLPRDSVDFNDCPLLPSPTLAEILAELPAVAYPGSGVLEVYIDDRKIDDGRYAICYNLYGDDGELIECTMMEADDNSATAALRMWFKVQEHKK